MVSTLRSMLTISSLIGLITADGGNCQFSIPYHPLSQVPEGPTSCASLESKSYGSYSLCCHPGNETQDPPVCSMDWLLPKRAAAIEQYSNAATMWTTCFNPPPTKQCYWVRQRGFTWDAHPGNYDYKLLDPGSCVDYDDKLLGYTWSSCCDKQANGALTCSVKPGANQPADQHPGLYQVPEKADYKGPNTVWTGGIYCYQT